MISIETIYAGIISGIVAGIIMRVSQIYVERIDVLHRTDNRKFILELIVILIFLAIISLVILQIN